MKITNLCIVPLLLLFHSFDSWGQDSYTDKIALKANWAIQSSRDVKEDGKRISTVGYKADGWYPATVPATVLATLVANKVYPDPYFGTNIESIPGYVADRRTANTENSPFKVSWWYRTEFSLQSGAADSHYWLEFQSINYKANIWVNGQLVADTNAIEGAFRLYKLDISKYALPGKLNSLALEIFPPKGMDLTITWVDWNPTPPDRGMGIWYDVFVKTTGPVCIEDPHIITKLNLPGIDTANLTVSAELRNNEDKPLKGILKCAIENIQFSQDVSLEAKETKQVTFTKNQFKQLVIVNPRVWWPHTLGVPNLYDLNLRFEINGKLSDSRKQRFGIREVSSWMNEFDKFHTRVFQINGKNLVIRGGGYVQDMMLRPDNSRIDNDIAYAKFMNLNALRMEGPRGSDYLFDKCDEVGIMLLVGWCCCSAWERWKSWTPHTADIAELSWKDQVLHYRNHPAIFDWLYGSDNFPPADVEKRYIKVLDECDGTRPYESSATQAPSAIAGNTGVWMGPYPKVYSYFPPSYWYTKLEFNTEAGPTGEQISPIESLRKMMPEKDIWPISHSWEIRLHKAFYPNARSWLKSRYGEPKSAEEYCMKSQVFQLEAVKAMFEAFASNKYRSSGIIYWMYNGAWPKLYWQLYDYYFTPNGAFYGARSANEQLHIQYAYDENSIRIINGRYKEVNDLNASIRVFNFDLTEKLNKEVPVSIGADESKKIFSLEGLKDLTNIYFLKIELRDGAGKLISSNFYWLSSKGDERADFTDLDKLPASNLKVNVSPIEKRNGQNSFFVEIENTGNSLAFALNPKVIKSSSKDLVLPVFCDDNYFSLLPKEKRKIKIEFNTADLGGEKPLFKIEGWNTKAVEKILE
jgi:exo-1,4-beta-D-glucosaminidase